MTKQVAKTEIKGTLNECVHAAMAKRHIVPIEQMAFPNLNKEETDALMEELKNPTSWGWALGRTTKEQVQSFMETYDEEAEPSLMQTILEQMESDGDDESYRLLRLYEEANIKERAIMDNVLLHLCGWAMSTLMDMNQESKGFAQEVPE